MFYNTPLTGRDLPAKTICLTFDDGPGMTAGEGPGPRSLELARFLHQRRISATFFVIGTLVAGFEHVLREIVDLGHLIANHSFHHVSLAGLDSAVAARDILEADRVLAKVSAGLPRLFRPPYGCWDNNLAGCLNWTEAWRYTGPVLWDIDGWDWQLWREGQSATACAEVYIKLIEQAGRGIVLMHDGTDNNDSRRKHRTFEAAQILVSWLQQNDYKFVRLDALPQIRAALRVSSVIALATGDGKCLIPQHGGGGKIVLEKSTTAIEAWRPLGVVPVDQNRMALRCLSGHYFSAQNGGGSDILATASAIGNHELLTREQLGPDLIALRCSRGHYLSPEVANSDEIRAAAKGRRWWFGRRRPLSLRQIDNPFPA
jgi:peptidoglycan/xylan/chitin deacetylase (PgdA/CDA1 family)